MQATLDLEDTIVAPSSPAGGGARAIVRMSGPAAFSVLSKTASLDTSGWGARWRGDVSIALPAVYASLRAEVLAARGPATHTGQDLAEFHLVGSMPIVDALLGHLVRHGCRLARPGEFTLRAFLAGKVDLPQAEAILGVIHATEGDQLRDALAQMSGNVSHPASAIRDKLLHLLAEVEAELDFAEEDLSFVTSDAIERELREADAALGNLLLGLDDRSTSGRPFRVVLSGPPNAGKSSLYNALLGQDFALVSPEAGTTRDFLRQRVRKDDLEIEFADTAGEDHCNDVVKSQAQLYRIDQLTQADLVLHCREAANQAQETAIGTGILVATKVDLLPEGHPVAGVPTSARTGSGVDELVQIVWQRARAARRPSALATSLARCRQHAERARGHLRRAMEQVRTDSPREFLALELRLALEQLGELVGAVTVEDLLDRVFSQFCIGK